MTSKQGSSYSWHMSLRIDRPIEACPVTAHAYMYSKRLDDSLTPSIPGSQQNSNSSANLASLNDEADDASPPSTSTSTSMSTSGLDPAIDGASPNVPKEKEMSGHNSKKIIRLNPPPQHSYTYQWSRTTTRPPPPCAFTSGCVRAAGSCSPLDWSSFKLGGKSAKEVEIMAQDREAKDALNKEADARDEAANSSNNEKSTSYSRTGSTSDLSSNNKNKKDADDDPGDTAGLSSTGSVYKGKVMCVDPRSNLFKKSFCNGNCFKGGWVAELKSGRYPLPKTDSASAADNKDKENNDKKESSDPNAPQAPSTKDAINPYANQAKEEEYTTISTSQIYTPQPSDVGHRIMLTVSAVDNKTKKILMSRSLVTEFVLSRGPDPPKRGLAFFKDPVTGRGASNTGGYVFRIVTYNVLAEIYATQQQYPYCDFWALGWDYRWGNIRRELKAIDGDLICLQEVQADHYDSHVYPWMSLNGYEGMYKQKTRDAMGLVGKVDGCALFWRRKKFTLVESYGIEFNELAHRYVVNELNPPNPEASLNRLKKDNVAQLAVLEFNQPANSRGPHPGPNQICVANTHLYSHKDYPDVKLWQAWQLLQQLEDFALTRQLPLMLCGDFNSTPENAVYDLLSSGVVHPGHPDVNLDDMVDGRERERVLPQNIHQLSHGFRLGSAYATVTGTEPAFTNYTGGFKGVLDYMWYSSELLRPLSTSPVPKEDEIRDIGIAMPSVGFSSDHILIMADMQFGGR